MRHDRRPERSDAIGGKILINAGALQRTSEEFQIAGVVNHAASQRDLSKAFAIQQVTGRQARGDENIANNLIPIGAQAVFDEQPVADGPTILGVGAAFKVLAAKTRGTSEGDAARQGAILCENENGMADKRLAVADGIHVSAEFEAVFAMPSGRRQEQVSDPLDPLGARLAALKKAAAVAFRSDDRGGRTAGRGIGAKLREREAGLQQHPVGEIGRILQAGQVFVVMLVGSALRRAKNGKSHALVFLMVDEEAGSDYVGRGQVYLRLAQAVDPPYRILVGPTGQVAIQVGVVLAINAFEPPGAGF